MRKKATSEATPVWVESGAYVLGFGSALIFLDTKEAQSLY